MTDKIYTATQILSSAYTQQIATQGEDNHVWLHHKLRHSFNVACYIMDIFTSEKNIYELFSSEERSLVESTAILHDLGRFYQYKDKKHIPSAIFDHGEEGAKMLLNNSDFNDKKMLFAIAEHGHYTINYDNPFYTSLSQSERQKADILVKLLRDADKFDNLRFFINYDKERIFGLPKGPLSENVKQDLSAKRTVNISHLQTASDGLAVKLSWVNDINFSATKKKLQDFDFINKCLTSMIERGASAEDIRFLQENLSY